jgi:hypothetical protein
MPAERMPAALSSEAGIAAFLQQFLPESGAGMGALEDAATLPQNQVGQGETESPKPALPGTGAEPETTKARSRWDLREGHHSRTFLRGLL